MFNHTYASASGEWSGFNHLSNRVSSVRSRDELEELIQNLDLEMVPENTLSQLQQLSMKVAQRPLEELVAKPTPRNLFDAPRPH